MIRRFSIALAAIAITAALTSSCSTFTANRDAARVDGDHLPVTQYESILQGLAQAPDSFGMQPVGPEGLPGQTARGILGKWVIHALMSATLAQKGVTISADDRKAVEDTIGSGAGADIWAKLTPELQAFVVDDQTIQPLFEQTFGADAGKALSDAATAATVVIDSRYGMWDASTGQVVPAR